METIRRGRPLIWGTVALLFLFSSPDPGRTAPSAPDPVTAIGDWTGQLADAEGLDRIRLLIRRGETYRTLGHTDAALADLQAAHEGATAAGDPLLTAVAAHGLGYVHFLQGKPDLAEPLLRSALEGAEAIDRSDLAASCANRLGTVLFNQDRPEEAYPLYERALDHLARTDDPALEAGVRSNLSRVLTDDRRAVDQLVKARQAADRVDDPLERTDLLLRIAAEAVKRGSAEGTTALAHRALTEALATAEELGATRRLSEAAGRLGALHEAHGNTDPALSLTWRALETAQSLRAHDLLIGWEWQLGRLQRIKGNLDDAMAAYRRAIHHIETIRMDIPIEYQDGRSSFRETLAPIYLGLADMLLARSAEAPEGSGRQALLREARRVVERIKRSELTDYFRDPCIAALSQGIESLSSDTAVLYPIILPDRLELLVDMGGRLERRTAPVARGTMEAAVTRLVRRLRDGSPFEGPGSEVFRWLVRPVVPLLDAGGITTLVYVPDGVLRLLPLAALWDGERFLVERYSVVTVPGLTLLDPAPLVRGRMVSLMAGMSEPGPVIYDLPRNFWHALRFASARKPNRGVRGITVETAHLASPETPVDGSSGAPEDMEQFKRALALPGVEKEIERLSRQLPGTVLFNEAFQREHFSMELQGHDYRVVHIASHGFFGGAPEQNFIMTYDKRLDMDALGALIRPKQLAARPVELITLSACQTAEGDDRSPLGISGVVLKSGARSALGSLWPVSDDAAQELLPGFYGHLEAERATKAEALRQAQMDLMKQDRFRHPFYWSPFILVGNWL